MDDHSHRKILYIGIAGALLLIGAGVFYYFVIFLPHEAALKAHQEQAAFEQQRQAETAQRQQAADQAAAEQQRKADQAANLQTCLDTAFSNHQSAWTTACTHIGIDSKGPDCSLPSYQAKAIEDAYTQAKADCFKQYPQN